jgi:hypothetical protein
MTKAELKEREAKVRRQRVEAAIQAGIERAARPRIPVCLSMAFCTLGADHQPPCDELFG